MRPLSFLATVAEQLFRTTYCVQQCEIVMLHPLPAGKELLRRFAPPYRAGEPCYQAHFAHFADARARCRQQAPVGLSKLLGDAGSCPGSTAVNKQPAHSVVATTVRII